MLGVQNPLRHSLSSKHPVISTLLRKVSKELFCGSARLNRTVSLGNGDIHLVIQLNRIQAS